MPIKIPNPLPATQVLREENMNQSAAAKRLGIGRSTLWRKIAGSGGK